MEDRSPSGKVLQISAVCQCPTQDRGISESSTMCGSLGIGCKASATTLSFTFVLPSKKRFGVSAKHWCPGMVTAIGIPLKSPKRCKGRHTFTVLMYKTAGRESNISIRSKEGG